MGLVDADYKFIYMDVGCNGRISDGGVFRNGQLSKALDENTLNIPTAESLPRNSLQLPFVVVGDDAFPLKKYLMKPYPHQGLGLRDDGYVRLDRLTFVILGTLLRGCGIDFIPLQRPDLIK